MVTTMIIYEYSYIAALSRNSANGIEMRSLAIRVRANTQTLNSGGVMLDLTRDNAQACEG